MISDILYNRIITDRFLTWLYGVHRLDDVIKSLLFKGTIARYTEALHRNIKLIYVHVWITTESDPLGTYYKATRFIIGVGAWRPKQHKNFTSLMLREMTIQEQGRNYGYRYQLKMALKNTFWQLLIANVSTYRTKDLKGVFFKLDSHH